MAIIPPPVPPIPTLAGFKQWVYDFMGVPPAALPSTSFWFDWAYDVAISLVNRQLQAVPGPIYMLAVYNLGGDNLVNWVQDDSTWVPPDFWAKLREAYGISGGAAFTFGFVTSAADEGTSTSLEILDSLKNLTLGQLLNVKTPWGRQYLAFAASVGTLWGIT